jgi:hypothetical protein
MISITLGDITVGVGPLIEENGKQIRLFDTLTQTEWLVNINNQVAEEIGNNLLLDNNNLLKKIQSEQKEVD